MKRYLNNGLIGSPPNKSDDGKFRSGVWDVGDVYDGKLQDDNLPVVRPMFPAKDGWANSDEDPFYKSVAIQMPQPPDVHLGKDWSQYGNCKFLLQDQYYRAPMPTFFGPRYDHWSQSYGENGYIKLNENNNQLQFSTGAFTIEFWMKRRRNDSTDHFIMGFGSSAGTTAGTGFTVYITAANKLAFFNASTSTTITGGTTLIVDQWYHIALVRTDVNTNGFKIYVDGALDATGTCGNFHPTGSTNFYIGRDRVATQSTFFGGLLTDIRITKTAVYSAAFTRPTAALDMTIANIVYHDSMKNRRFWTDYGNQANFLLQIPVTLEANQIVKIIDSPFFTETTHTAQAHGTHSSYCWDRTQYLKYLDIDPSNTSLRFGTSAFTVEAWFYNSIRATNNAICGKGNSTNGWTFLVDSSNRISWVNNGTTLTTTAAVTNNYVAYGGWYHIAAVREGTGTNQFKMYVNGKLEYTGTVDTDYDNLLPLYTFGDRGGSTLTCGHVCGIRISKVARYTADFDVSTTTFIDSSMSVADSNVVFLSSTTGTNKLIATQAHYIDYGKYRVPQYRRGNEVRESNHSPSSSTGFCIGSTDTTTRVLLKSNNRYTSWTKVGTSTWSMVDCGLRHMGGVKTDGTLWMWGDNQQGQLGTNDFMSRTAPTQIGTDTNWKQVSCGANFTVAVKTNGELWAWGCNDQGRLGLNDTIYRQKPQRVSDVNITTVSRSANVATLTTAVNHNFAVGQQITIVCSDTSYNATNVTLQAGTTGTTIVYNNTGNNQTSTSTQINSSYATITNWSEAWACHKHDYGWVLAKKSDNTLWFWGWNGWYGAGDTGSTNSSVPKAAGGGTADYSRVFMGYHNQLAIKTNGELWAWGNNDNGKWGNGTTTWNATAALVGGSGISYIWAAAGREHCLAIRSNGTLWSAGWAGHGQLGTGTGDSKSSWQQIGSATNWTKCWASQHTSYALKSDGTLWAFGKADLGQYGDGKEFQSYVPVQCTFGLSIDMTYQSRGGEQHMAILTTAGDLYVAGGENMFQMGSDRDSAFNWGTGDFSFEFWAKQLYDQRNLDTNNIYSMYLFDARNTFADRPNGDTDTWAIKHNHNTNEIQIYLAGKAVLWDEHLTAQVSNNMWMHYCWQRVNGVMALYANGKKVREVNYPYKIRAHGNQITALNGSAPYLYYGNGSYGAISDIRINRGTAAYASGTKNPVTIEVPIAPLKSITGTVFQTACGPILRDYSGQTTFYNEVRSEGNPEQQDWNRDNWNAWALSFGPYTKSKLERNNITTGIIKPMGDTWDATNWSESHSYHHGGATANQYPEYSWITRMVKPWTIEFWFYGHTSVKYYNSITNHRRLYTATSAGHEGWEIWYGNVAPGSTSPRPETWGAMSFKLWTAHNSSSQVFATNDTSMYRAHSWNHVAVVFDPTGTNKMAWFMNGKRVGSTTTALTGGQKVWNTYYLQNETTGISSFRLSDIARYSVDSTTYTIPLDSNYNASWTLDNNTIHCSNAEHPSYDEHNSYNLMAYGIHPNYTYKKFGNASWFFPGIEQTNGLGPPRMYFATNNWRYTDGDSRMRDITLEAWCSWWDGAVGSLSFTGNNGIRLANSTTLNQTNACISFWIKASSTQSANPTIWDSYQTTSATNTGAWIALGGASKSQSVTSTGTSTVVSTTGTIGSITGTGPWTATITGMTNTDGLYVGSTITATAGTGALFGGSPTAVVVASIVNKTSITYTVTGGTTPVAGTITNISTSSNLITVPSTEGYYPGMPVTFTGTTLTGSNIVIGTTYYIRPGFSATQFGLTTKPYSREIFAIGTSTGGGPMTVVAGAAHTGKLLFSNNKFVNPVTISKTTLTDNQWHYVVIVTYTQQTWRRDTFIYIDGKLEAKSWGLIGNDNCYFQDGQIGYSRTGTGNVTGYGFNGLLCNLHYHSDLNRYMSNWNRWGNTSDLGRHPPYNNYSFNPLPHKHFDYQNNLPELSSTAAGNAGDLPTFNDYESGTVLVPVGPEHRINYSVMLLNAESTQIGNGVSRIVLGGTNNSTGFTNGASVTFTAPQLAGGVTATGVLVVTSGQITGVTITNSGSGYTSAPTMTLPTGTQGTLTLTVVLTTFDFKTGETITYRGVHKDNANDFVNYASGSSVASVTLGGTNNSSGYTQGAAVTFSAPYQTGGVTATGFINVTSGQITSITITHSGSGYITAPTITLPAGTQGTLTVTANLGSNTLPTRSTDTPWYSAGSIESFPARPRKYSERDYGGTLFNYSGGPHVYRDERGFWCYTYTSDFQYDRLYPRRITAIRTNIRARNMSEGADGWDHVVLQRSALNWSLYINGVLAGTFNASNHGAQSRPWEFDNQNGDYSSTYVYIGSHSNAGWERAWAGCIQDFRMTNVARYTTRVINGVETMCHRNTHFPALPGRLNPTVG